MAKLLVQILGWLLPTITLVVTVLSVTGQQGRAYAVLAAGTLVDLGDQSLTVDEIAHRYQPTILLRPNTDSPPAVEMWYEAILLNGELGLVYHPIWKDEIHPKRWAHLAYSVFRAIYYGMPLWDIEYIQINVDLDTGRILRVRYETGEGDEYDRDISEHLSVLIDRVEGQYIERWENRAGELVEGPRPIKVAGNKPLDFGVLTWNHLLVLISDRSQYTVPMPMELIYLTEQNYARHKLCRRSQGDFVTPDHRLKIPLIVVLVLGISLSYVIQRWIRSTR